MHDRSERRNRPKTRERAGVNFHVVLGSGDVGDTFGFEHRSMATRHRTSSLGFVAGDGQLVLVFVNRDRLTGTTVSILQQSGGSEGGRNATIGGVGPVEEVRSCLERDGGKTATARS
ncbi:uncharacterized protein PpBr36_09411 [Pyricularia pennisetigena]|uniref:uncharacterized protein n=1 Tax=Pyricularia pennisetigena TaxID=1578925 RepID=UPI00114DA1DA|nr:uncharacterized protein PpBr36_09411 [Pyricularia pennisetigena]TLS21675.1 hypothetical protein PpBr36_09411 [Pyricularia pennisetigena]